MNTIMKYINKKSIFVMAFAVALFMGGFSSANAQTTFNNHPNDLDTVKVMNVSQYPNSTTNWVNSVTANPGQTIAVRVYYHNTGTVTATNTLINLGPQNTNLGHNFSFSGNVTSSNCTNCPQSGTAYVNITGSQSQTLTYVPGSAIWYNTNPIGAGIPLNSQQVAQLFGGGLNIGNVLPDGTANGCPSFQTWCHQGTVRAQFVVSNNTAPVACSINSFYASPSNNIPYNSSTNLSWTTTGANSVTISGISGTLNADGSVQTGNLQNSTSFTLTANCINGNNITQSAYVSVANQPGCSVSNFTAYPTTVTSGGTSTLNWNTTGSISNITITGFGLGSGDISHNNSGTLVVGPLNSSGTFTMTVNCANGQTIVRTVYISVTQPTVYQCSDNIDNDGDGKIDYPADPGCYGPTDNNEYNTITQTPTPVCTINSFSASQGWINYGASTNLLWTTSNCTNVNITSIGSVSPVSAGSHTTGALTQDTTYTITATNSNYNSTASPRQYTVRVGNSPTCYINSFSASPNTVAYNSPANLIWATSNCVSASITNIGSVVTNGSAPTGNLIMQTVYTLTALGANGNSDTKNVTVYVSQQPQQGYCTINSFNANPSTVNSGSTTTLSWSTSNNCTDVSISSIGQVATSGSTLTNPITGYTVFTLSASVNGGAIQTRTAIVNITNTPVPPQPPVYTYACNDHNDNDGDGYIDYPFDPGCSYATDNDEYNYVAPQVFACNDGLDNDGDGYRDLNDPGCTSFSDNDEYNYVAPQVYVCNDHIDNDFDGLYDYPYDPGCISYYDTSEYNYVAPTPNPNPVTYIYTGSGGSGVPLMTLKIESRFQTVSAGDTIDYTVTYKNIANRTTLKDVVVELQFPENVDFVQSTRGLYSTLDSRLTLDVGSLAPQAEESFFVQAKVNFKAKTGDVLSTSGTASYVTPSNTQGVVKAFAMNTVSNNGNSFLAGLALFGADEILPNSLIGWLLLILIIFLLVMLGRRAFTPTPVRHLPTAPLPH